ncbi:MAG: hypothetical protein IKO55_06415 [Kiritimatiellae bacterium]|nr:hypothetical protein [Kiritimatiellia bacterium]
MIECFHPITFFALVPDVERKMWTLAKGRTRRRVYLCDGKSALKRQLGKDCYNHVANILVPNRYTFEGFDKAGKLQEFRQTSLYWAGVWQCWKTKKTIIATIGPDITRSGFGESLCERGGWGMPIGYNFSHLSSLKDMKWYDLEIYAKPETPDGEKESQK